MLVKLFLKIKTLVNLYRNAGRENRRLEIGAGSQRIEGFETLNIAGGSNVDYVCDAAKRLPFPDDTFEVIYASHILEHIPWYQTLQTLIEWRRVLRPGGTLNIWVPDGLKICSVFVDYEMNGIDRTSEDGWYRYNDDKDPCLWASGRIFTYGDGRGDLAHPNWHRAIFTERFLKKIFHEVGFIDINKLSSEDVLGYDHGWINMGLRGKKS